MPSCGLFYGAMDTFVEQPARGGKTRNKSRAKAARKARKRNR